MGRKAGSKNKSTLIAENKIKAETPWVPSTQVSVESVQVIDPEEALKAKILRKCREKAYDDYTTNFSDRSRECIDGLINMFMKNVDEHFLLKKRK